MKPINHRAPISDRERRLIRSMNAALRKSGYQRRGPEVKELQSYLANLLDRTPAAIRLELRRACGVATWGSPSEFTAVDHIRRATRLALSMECGLITHEEFDALMQASLAGEKLTVW